MNSVILNNIIFKNFADLTFIDVNHFELTNCDFKNIVNEDFFLSFEFEETSRLLTEPCLLKVIAGHKQENESK